jgi:hypothetical protein
MPPHMNDKLAQTPQLDMFGTHATKSLLDQLITDSRLYTQSKDYKDLLDFVVRLRNFAPFNAMLLHVQKPGLSYAASEHDWQDRFGRRIKEGVRPLLILWPFGPVALVYDVQDTEGKDLPKDVACFLADGAMTQERIGSFIGLMSKKMVGCKLIDTGDGAAGSLGVVKRPENPKELTTYRMFVNRNHLPPVQFATIAHELAHLFLGHLGPDKALNIPERPPMNGRQRELEAESVAYVVCARNGIRSRSETYLAHYVTQWTTIDAIDVYQVMRAAGQVESLLELTPHMKFSH